MSRKPHKIPAFTLSEMLVVLLITAIVVGMAFSVLSLVERQMRGIEGNFAQNTEHNRLRQALWVDFNRTSSAEFDHIGDRLILYNGIEAIVYEFKTDAVIRERDTFRLVPGHKQWYFRNQPRTGGEIDALDLTGTKEDERQRIFVYKRNAADIYMNQ